MKLFLKLYFSIARIEAIVKAEALKKLSSMVVDAIVNKNATDVTGVLIFW